MDPVNVDLSLLDSPVMAPAKADRVTDLPTEVQELILSHLDLASLLSCEAACKSWRGLLGRCPIYRKKCLQLEARRPTLSVCFRRHGFQSRCGDARWCKDFLLGLEGLIRDDWGGGKSKEAGIGPAVTVLDCLEAEVDGRGVDADNPEWRRRHNYVGVYDMVYDLSSGRLVCSVYDTIQVWDADSLECLQIVTADILDPVPVDRTACFGVAAGGRLLVAGSRRGNLRLVDLVTGKACPGSWSADQPSQRNPVADVKVEGDEVLTVDNRGQLQEWRLEAKARRLVHGLAVKLDHPERICEDYWRPNSERLLDFSDRFAVTSSFNLLLLLGRGGGGPTYKVCQTIDMSNNVLCLKAMGELAFVGEQNGVVSRLHYESLAGADHMGTRYGDNITSLDASADRVVAGDVNGEVHVCSWANFGKNKDSLPDYTLESGHADKSFVWCVKADAERMFSGDQDGKLVVHDFWRGKDAYNEEEQGAGGKRSKQGK